MQFTKIKLLLLVAALLSYPVFAHGQTGEPLVITADKLADNKNVATDKLVWKYRAGDEAAWAAKDFDDGGWKSLTNDEINADPLAALEDWSGRAWFRLRVNVDESLVNQPLACRVWHWSASEIYIDGKLIERFGTIDASGDTEFNPRGLFIPVVFANGGTHVIAVRHSFQAAENLRHGRGR